MKSQLSDTDGSVQLQDIGRSVQLQDIDWSVKLLDIDRSVELSDIDRSVQLFIMEGTTVWNCRKRLSKLYSEKFLFYTKLLIISYWTITIDLCRFSQPFVFCEPPNYETIREIRHFAYPFKQLAYPWLRTIALLKFSKKMFLKLLNLHIN